MRQGSIFLSNLERRHIGRALFAVVMDAYFDSMKARKVDDLVAAPPGQLRTGL